MDRLQLRPAFSQEMKTGLGILQVCCTWVCLMDMESWRIIEWVVDDTRSCLLAFRAKFYAWNGNRKEQWENGAGIREVLHCRSMILDSLMKKTCKHNDVVLV